MGCCPPIKIRIGNQSIKAASREERLGRLQKTNHILEIVTQPIVLLDGVNKCHSVEVVGPGAETSMVETYTITTYNTVVED